MRSSQSHERFLQKEKHLPVVKRSVCNSQDLYYRSGHLHLGRFSRQTVGRNILFGRIERSTNLQLTGNQNLSYRTNTTNDFVVEIQPAINMTDGNTYILINEIFYPTMLFNVNKVMEENFYFSFEIIVKNFIKDQYALLATSPVHFEFETV